MERFVNKNVFLTGTHGYLPEDPRRQDLLPEVFRQERQGSRQEVVS